MHLTLNTGNSKFQIQSFDPGKLVVNGQPYTQSIILTDQELISPWRPQSFTELNADDLKPLLATQPELILLGTGERQQFPNSDILGDLSVGTEIMDTYAACRTYNLLAAEGRHLAAALLIK